MIFFIETTSPKIANTISCLNGWNDQLFGGPGTVDFIFGGGYNDTIEGNEGMDLVFGDHASVSFFEESHKLLYAKTTDTSCRGGYDFIQLGDGDDLVSPYPSFGSFLPSYEPANVFLLFLLQAFGGAYSDEIYGDEGQDTILGDFGHYNAEVEFLPYQHFVSDIHYPNYTGNDSLYGGMHDDILMGQEVS